MFSNPALRTWIYFFSLLFLGVNMFFVISQDVYWLNLLPVGIFIVGMAVMRTDYFLLLLAFLTPLSVSLEKLEFGLGVNLPTEPLMFGALLLFVVHLSTKGFLNIKYWTHPISITVVLSVLWTFISSLNSEMPVVSMKFFLSRLWFVCSFFIWGMWLFRDRKRIPVFIWLYVCTLAMVIVYTLINHFLNAFDEKAAHWVMQPFFKDHTSYGALVAFFIPFIVIVLFKIKNNIYTKIIISFVLLLFMAGLIFSYTRAAWVSLIGALGVYLLIYWRIRLSYIFMGLGIVIGSVFYFQHEILISLERNKQDSSEDLMEHVQSISNVASDASNLERINRWSCAVRMFAKRPVFGYGPGTYSFLYAPFQHSSQLTIISTNFGDLGNAHSEYLGPLAEQGLLGFVFLMVLIVVFYQQSIRLIIIMHDRETALYLLGLVLGMTTYLIHGILNNFLDTDKASVPFWACMAIVVVLDIQQSNSSENKDHQFN